MKHILYRIVLLLLPGITPAVTVFGQPGLGGLPFVRTFTTLDYNAGIQNWDIAQDKRGILYLANNFGLLEFDGTTWETYRVTNGTKVRSVAIDGHGRIYVGCQGDFGYFFPDTRGKLVYTSLADSLPPDKRNFDETWSVYVDNHRVYFCTFSTIYVYNGQQFDIAEAETDLELSFLVNRKLFVTSRSRGIDVLTDKQFVTVNGAEHFINKSVSSILPLHQDELLISTFQHGIFRMQQGVVNPWGAQHNSFFKESIVNCMTRLRNGNIAVGTQNNGLLILNAEGSVLTHLTAGQGLENRTVLSLYEDELNNLWIGQNNGIGYVELGSPFTFIDEQSGVPGSGYAAFLDDNTLYLGTNTGLYTKNRSPESKYQLLENTRGQVYHIGKYSGEILVGHHNGTLAIRNDRAVQICSEPGSWTFIHPTDRSSFLVGGSYTGLHRYELRNNQWHYMKKYPAFHESSRIMSRQSNGSIWMTHGYKGAFQIQFTPSLDSIHRFSLYGSTNGFPSNNLINVFPIKSELMFTSEQGIFQYDRKTDSFVKDKLFTNILGENVQLWAIQQDALENIYFIGSEHIGVLKRNALGNYDLETNTFNKIRKYLNDDLVNISVLKNNQVLFGAKDGFIHYNPAMNVKRNTDFTTLIRNVSTTSTTDSVLFYGNYLRNDSVSVYQLKENQPALDYNANSINFSFSATTFEGPEIYYQYYLEHYEKGWSDWTTKTFKEYTNLKEGKYTFHVRSRNTDGVISKEALYHFSVRPPWYRSLWSYSIYGATVIALLFTAFHLLDRKYQKEQQLMALKQKKELTRKDKELFQLTVQSQEEINRLQHEKLESELRHMNNELGTSTMHLLNKNEFITGIKENLNQLLKKTENPEVTRALHQITKNIETNISDDADWEHFQYHFDRVHGDFSSRFKSAFPALSPQEIKLSAYLRMNLSSKEIAHLLNISVRGVEISRYRLRKKLRLERNTNLQEFILNF